MSKQMTSELVQAIERMNNIEKDYYNKWHRGDTISEELLERLNQARAQIRQLTKEQDN